MNTNDLDYWIAQGNLAARKAAVLQKYIEALKNGTLKNGGGDDPE